ncbi:MAG: dephospho-CoA kinase [Gemmatimonadaceae bacterium]
MRLFGLTGNIASGKSVVADMLAERGATIIDADVLSREVVEPGTPALEAIASRWGDEVLDDSGNLDRAALRKIVFQDDAELGALNDIVHPEVGRRRKAEIEAARNRGDAVVVCVIPLLFERRLTDQFEMIILVDAPRSVRTERMVSNRGLTEADAMKMIAAQMPADLKRARADYVIENAGTIEALEREVDRVWQLVAGDGITSFDTADVP